MLINSELNDLIRKAKNPNFVKDTQRQKAREEMGDLCFWLRRAQSDREKNLLIRLYGCCDRREFFALQKALEEEREAIADAKNRAQDEAKAHLKMECYQRLYPSDKVFLFQLAPPVLPMGLGV